jgi:hypothetical protein
LQATPIPFPAEIELSSLPPTNGGDGSQIRREGVEGNGFIG